MIFFLISKTILCKAQISSSILGHAILIRIATFTPFYPGVATKLFGTTILQLTGRTEAERKINNKKHTKFQFDGKFPFTVKVTFWKWGFPCSMVYHHTDECLPARKQTTIWDHISPYGIVKSHFQRATSTENRNFPPKQNLETCMSLIVILCFGFRSPLQLENRCTK